MKIAIDSIGIAIIGYTILNMPQIIHYIGNL